MNLALFLLTLAVVAAVVAIVMGRLPGGMPDPSSAVPPVRLPDGPLTSADVHDLRFVPALRGYRMDQVDDALDRLAREVDRLRAYLPPEQLAALEAAKEPGPDDAGQPELTQSEPVPTDTDTTANTVSPWAPIGTSERAGR